MKLNQQGVINTLLAVIITALIAGGVVVAIENYNQHNANTASIKVSSSPSFNKLVDSPVKTVKAAYALYNDGRGTQSQSAWARIRDSHYVTAKLAAFFDDIDKGRSRLQVDPMGCAQNISDQPRTYTVSNSTATTATIIAKQPFGVDGSHGATETSIDLIRNAGAWKLDAVTCVPVSAQ